MNLTRNSLLLYGGLLLALSVGGPLVFTVGLPAIEWLGGQVNPEHQRPGELPPCPRDYFLSTRDGETITVDKGGHECEL